MRPISEGEEVTVCYFQEILEPATVTHERQKYLLEGYNFKCTCSICARSSKAAFKKVEPLSYIQGIPANHMT
jgi:hypothetical protein